MANFRAASMSPEFEFALDSSHADLRGLLERHGITSPMIFAQLTREPPGSPAALLAFENLLPDLRAKPEDRERMAADCLRLHSVATAAAPELAARLGTLSKPQQSADFHELSAKRARGGEQHDLNRLALHSLAHLPAQWRGSGAGGPRAAPLRTLALKVSAWNAYAKAGRRLDSFWRPTCLLPPPSKAAPLKTPRS